MDDRRGRIPRTIRPELRMEYLVAMECSKYDNIVEQVTN